MKGYVVGVPRERKEKEGRVGMTPSGVREIVSLGLAVLVESGAGVLSGFPDQSYVDAGATIVVSPERLYVSSDIIVKVKEPIPEEYYLLAFFMGKTLFTYLHLAGVSRELTLSLLRNGITALAYENVTKIEEGRTTFPLLEPMSRIAGTQSMRQAIERHPHPERHALHAVILGGGTVGEYALNEALKHGVAHVSVFELRKERVLQLRRRYGPHMGTKVSVLRLEQLYQRRGTCALQHADILVSGVLKPGAEAPKVLTEKEFALMKQGCYIADVAIDQGGSTVWSRPTKPSETYEQHGLVFSCVPNIPGSTVPREATIALTNATLPYIRLIAGYAGSRRGDPTYQALINHDGFRAALQVYRGAIMNQEVASTHGLMSMYRSHEHSC